MIRISRNRTTSPSPPPGATPGAAPGAPPAAGGPRAVPGGGAGGGEGDVVLLWLILIIGCCRNEEHTAGEGGRGRWSGVRF